jgi:excisionase family DNA binding protein
VCNPAHQRTSAHITAQPIVTKQLRTIPPTAYGGSFRHEDAALERMGAESMQHSPLESRQAQATIRNLPSITPLITQAAAAKLSGLTRRQIAELVVNQHLASVQVGRRRLVYRRSLDALLLRDHGRAA